MISKLTLDRPGTRKYYTVKPAASATSGWDEHIFYLNGTSFQVTAMWRETANAPVTPVSMSLFSDCLYDRLWTSDDTVDGFRVSPMDVISNIDAYPTHKERILRANMAYAPIAFCGVFNGLILKNVILVGNHRLTFAQLGNRKDRGKNTTLFLQIILCIRPDQLWHLHEHGWHDLYTMYIPSHIADVQCLTTWDDPTKAHVMLQK